MAENDQRELIEDLVCRIESVKVGNPMVIKTNTDFTFSDKEKIVTDYTVMREDCDFSWNELMRCSGEETIVRFYKEDDKFKFYIHHSREIPCEIDPRLYSRIRLGFLKECGEMLKTEVPGGYECCYLAFSDSGTKEKRPLSACVVVVGCRPETIYMKVSTSRVGVHEATLGHFVCNSTNVIFGPKDPTTTTKCALVKDEEGVTYQEIDLNGFLDLGAKPIHEIFGSV